MARLRYDNAVGRINASLTSGATGITFLAVPPFATLSGGDYIPLVLEPASDVVSANLEIVHLTAYTAGNLTGTISRGQEKTTGVAHATLTSWLCGPVAYDLSQQPFVSPYGGSQLLVPQHYWPCSDAASPAVDQSQMVFSSQVNLPGTNTSFNQTGSPPRNVSAYVSCATNGFMHAATPADVDAGSMLAAFWLNPGTASGNYVFGCGDSSGNGWFLHLLTGNAILFNYGGGGRNFTSTVTIPASTWTRVAVGTSSSGIRIYLNGQLRVTSTNTVGSGLASGHVIANGLYNSGTASASGLACSFAEVRFYSGDVGGAYDRMAYADYALMNAPQGV